MKARTLIIMGLTFFASARAFAPPVSSEPLGAGCLGGENQQTVYFAADGTVGITEREFYDTYRGGIWLQGEFDPTAESGPCNILPGGD